MSLQKVLLGMISELALWGLVGLLVVLFSKGLLFPGQAWDPPRGQRFTLVFRDISQLMVGSPVNFMGTDIGYVIKVKPQDGLVLVRFETYPDTPPIPKGAIFSIQFNGLAGAKTLEVLPPGSQPSSPYQSDYVVLDPIRLKDVMEAQMALATALSSSSRNLYQSLGRVPDVDILTRRFGRYQQQLGATRHRLHRVGLRIEKEQREVSTMLTRAQVMLSGLESDLQWFSRIKPSTLSVQLNRGLTRTQTWGTQFEQWCHQNPGQLPFQSRFKDWQTQQNRIRRTASLLSKGLRKADHVVVQLDRFLVRWDTRMSKKSKPPGRIQRLRQALPQWRERFQRWSNALK